MTIRHSLLVASAALAGTLLTATAVSATGQAAAASTVLTYGSAGGSSVAVGDVLSAASSSVAIRTTSGGSTGITCDASSFSASVATNPAAPGTATESLSAFSIGGSCSTNIVGTTSVKSITAGGLPYATSVTSSGTVTVQGPLTTTVVLGSLLGNVTCGYTADSLTGTASNTDSSIAFSNQEFTKSSGSSLCPGSGYFTATYGPVKDTTAAGSPSVFTN
ncbi:Tat pathway signal sequence domain protein [Streptomyces odontomachi]|uniref:Tat pathway signal sequence domain protein n=1 Tax=Streptomyces odontomachi TaxID=2944940 RepID=UPI00210EB4A9|nr:Tat pathway signal sequence domain protein [Streptomyces sp. ODS25]